MTIAQMRAQIKASLARQGAPNVADLIEHDRLIVFSNTQRAGVGLPRAAGAIAFAEVPDAVALVAWLHKDAMIKRLDAEKRNYKVIPNTATRAVGIGMTQAELVRWTTIMGRLKRDALIASPIRGLRRGGCAVPKLTLTCLRRAASHRRVWPAEVVLLLAWKVSAQFGVHKVSARQTSLC